MVTDRTGGHAAPLARLDEWEDSLLDRYSTDGSSRGFRDFDHPERAGIREFYRLNHRHQTFDFAAAKKEEFSRHDRARMSVWEALEFLNTLVDDSDPDLGLSQLDHLLQTAEAIRGDGHPDWFVLTGLVHDLGKVLCLWEEPQWAVVGDTFPVGCAFDERVVYQELFAHNPDSYDPRYRSELGVYDANCGLRRVRMSWGHDEYLFGVLEPYLPEPALYMIRYHSFYAAHREGAYDHLMNDHDREMFAWVRTFNPYDLYSKSDTAPDLGSLRPYYEDLVDHYLPPVLSW